MNKEEINNIICECNNDYEILNETYNYIDKLEKENKQLQQENKQLKETNKVLSEELTKDKILKQDCLTTCCGIPLGDIPKLKEKIDELRKFLNSPDCTLYWEMNYLFIRDRLLEILNKGGSNE